jgi:hypothetical protein
MPNQRATRATKVPKGTAPEDFSPQMNKFSTKKMQKILPGNAIAVYKEKTR